MGIIIIGIVISLLVGGICFYTSENTWGRKQTFKGRIDDAMGGTAVTAGICGFLIFLVTLGCMFNSIDGRNDLDVTYTENLAEYKQAVDMTYEGIQGIDTTAPLSFENATQIQAYERAVSDYRSAAVEFNEKFKRHSYWQNNWFIGVLYVDLPSDLDYVSITD